jgi:hypothetical protein
MLDPSFYLKFSDFHPIDYFVWDDKPISPKNHKKLR